MEDFIKSGIYGNSDVKAQHKEQEDFGGQSFGFLSSDKKSDGEKSNVLDTNWSFNMFGQEFSSVLPNIPEADGSPTRQAPAFAGVSSNVFGSNGTKNVAAMLPADFGGFGSKTSGPKVDTAALFGLKKTPKEDVRSKPANKGLFEKNPGKGLFSIESTETKGESGWLGSLGSAGSLAKSGEAKLGEGPFGMKPNGISNSSFVTSDLARSKGPFGTVSGLGDSKGLFGSSGNRKTDGGTMTLGSKSSDTKATAEATQSKSNANTDPAVDHEGVKKYQEWATRNLFQWYKQHNPEKIPKMKTMLSQKYKGREGIFYLWICQKKKIPYEPPPYRCRTRATLAPENEYCFGDGGCFPEFPQLQNHPLFKKKNGAKKEKETPLETLAARKPPLGKKKKPTEPKPPVSGSFGRFNSTENVDFSSFAENQEEEVSFQSYNNPLDSRLPEQVSWLDEQVEGVAQHCKALSNMMKSQPNCSVTFSHIEKSLEKLALNVTSGESYREVTATHSQLIGNIALTKSFMEGSMQECSAAEREATEWIRKQKTRMESNLNECEKKLKTIRESLKVRKIEMSTTEKIKGVKEVMKQNNRIIKALESRISVLERQRAQDGIWKRTSLKSPKSIPTLTTPLITPKHRGKSQLLLDQRPKPLKVKPDETSLKPVTISFSLPPASLDAPPNMVSEKEYKKNASAVVAQLLNLMEPTKTSTFDTPTPKQSRSRLQHGGLDLKPLSHKVIWPEDRRSLEDCQIQLQRLNVSRFRSPKERLPFPPIPKSPKPPPKVQPTPPPPLIKQEPRKPPAAPVKPKVQVTPVKELTASGTTEAKEETPNVFGVVSTSAKPESAKPAVAANSIGAFGQPNTNATATTAIDEYVKRITQIYNTNPKADASKLAGVLNKLKTKYSGAPGQKPPHNLYLQICKKYSLTPEPEYKGAAATSGFGISSSSFGSTQTTTNVFGTTTPSTNVFAKTTTPASTGFGTSTPSTSFGTTTNAFGTSTATNAFGQPTTNAFGTNTTGFGTTSTTNAFGQPSSSAFGTTSTSGGFGSLSTSGFGGATTGGGFGSFGTSTSGFGSPGGFGAPTTTTSAFGNTTGSGFSSFAGNTGGFGGAAKTGMSSSIFGSSTSSNNFKFDTGAFR